MYCMYCIYSEASEVPVFIQYYTSVKLTVQNSATKRAASGHAVFLYTLSYLYRNPSFIIGGSGGF